MPAESLLKGPGLTFALFLVVLVFGYVDYVTGPDVDSVLFFLIPILAAGYYLRRRYVFLISFASSVAWFVADIETLAAAELWLAAWNGANSFVIFSLVGLLVNRIRGDQHTKEVLNERLNLLLERETNFARTDVLTGLPNSRYFMELLKTEIARCSREHRALCVVYIDLDNFKRVNDRYSHEGGDAVLVKVAGILRASVRAGDVAARLGGDEFAVLLGNSTADKAREVGERLVKGVTSLASEYPGTDISCSAGVAYFDSPPADALEVIRQADNAMYRVKVHGKRGTEVVRAG